MTTVSRSSFPRAEAVARGCGNDRTPGGLYVECGLSPTGRAFDDFLLDPPQPLPGGLSQTSLANKPAFWEDPTTGTVHLVLWIGKEHYPFLPDFIEEGRRHGISRKISPKVLQRPDCARLSRESRLILAHTRTINRLWSQQMPPLTCKKAVPHHAPQCSPSSSVVELNDAVTASGGSVARMDPGETSSLTPAAAGRHEGPCLYKLWELIPASEAVVLKDPSTGAVLINPMTGTPRRKGFMLGTREQYYRRTGATEYLFSPTGEGDPGLVAEAELYEEGIFGVFPITGFALVKHTDGSVDPQSEAILDTLWHDNGVPYYRADK